MAHFCFVTYFHVRHLFARFLSVTRQKEIMVYWWKSSAILSISTSDVIGQHNTNKRCYFLSKPHIWLENFYYFATCT